MKNSTQFQEIIGYEFKEPSLLQQALTHSSYVKERGISRLADNERLEFLGDAFFDAIIGEALFLAFPEAEEGFLTKARASMVCEKSLAKEGRQLRIGDFIQCSKGEEKSGGRDRDSIIADAMEAVIGAIYVDGGYRQAKAFVLRIFQNTLQDAEKGKLTNHDYKSQLQEVLQAKGIREMKYVMEKEDGPDHNKTFYVRVEICGESVGSGQGKSKKEAEQQAAKSVIERQSHVL